MSIKLKALLSIFILCVLRVSHICAQEHYNKYYTHVISTEFLSDKLLEKQVDVANIDMHFLNAAIFHLTNIERVKASLSVLGFYDKLYRSASLHSEMMIKHDFFDHLNKKQRQWREPSDRIFYFDDSYRAIAENIVENNLLDHEGSVLRYRTEFTSGGTLIYLDHKGELIRYASYLSIAKRLVLQWMNSPPHRANILDERFNLLGCACGVDLEKVPILIRCTQNFAGME